MLPGICATVFDLKAFGRSTELVLPVAIFWYCALNSIKANTSPSDEISPNKLLALPASVKATEMGECRQPCSSLPVFVYLLDVTSAC